MKERISLEQMLRMDLPAPVPNGPPVLSALPHLPSAPLVRRAVEIRTEIGVERYGTPMYVHDGRHEADAGQEAGDLAHYLLRSVGRGDKDALALLSQGQGWLADVLAWACGWLDGEIDVFLPCLDPSSGESTGEVDYVAFGGDHILTGPALRLHALGTGKRVMLNGRELGRSPLRIDDGSYPVRSVALQSPTMACATVTMRVLVARGLMRDLLKRGWKAEMALVDDVRFQDLLAEWRDR